MPQQPVLRLLGAPSMRCAGGDERPLAAERAVQLLVVLVCRRDWVSRNALATLLWPEIDQASARRNLRKIVFRAGKLPGIAAPQSRADALRWLVDSDLAQFDAALARCDWRSATALYRGALAEGFELSASAAFADWLHFERARVAGRFRDAALRRLDELADDAPARVALATHWLALDPLEEDAAAALIEAERAAGHGAQAQRVFREFAERLAEQVGIEPSVRLRELPRALDAPLPRALGAPLSRSRASTPAPAAASDPLVGRRAELRTLTQRLAQPECRVLTLTGPGGIGKSRLARAALSALAADFGEAAWWIDLDDLSDPGQVAPRLAAAMGVELAGSDDPLARVIERLRSRRSLIVFDNCEHLAGFAPLVERLIHHCSETKLLNTSRSRLAIAGEWLVPLAGLPVPDEDETEIDALAACDSVKLFELRARAAASLFSLPEQAADVAALVRVLEGTPLAIELAAAWVRLLPVAEIRRELLHSLDLLVDNGQAEGRQHGVRASFDHSWRLLTPVEQGALARLTVFPGSFTRGAAAQVADAPLAMLAALHDKSLLRADGAGRFSFHALVQQCAAERRGDDAVLRRRHAEFYAQLLARHADFERGDHKAALVEIGIELENCRAAWMWAVHARALPLIETMAAPLTGFFEAKGRLAEGVALLSMATPLVDDAAADVRGAAAALWCSLAALNYKRGDPAAAETIARRALRLCRAAGAESGLQRCLAVIGATLWRRGEFVRAQRYYEQGLRRADATGSDEVRGKLHSGLAGCAMSLGDYARAHVLYAEALADYRRSGNTQGEVSILNNVGSTLYGAGRYDEARRHFERGLGLCDEHGFSAYRGVFLLNLGLTELQLCNFDRAAQVLAAALAAARMAGESRMLALSLEGLGRVATRRGDPAGARAYLHEGLALAQATGETITQLGALVCVAEWLAAAHGERARAAALLRFAIDHPAIEAADRDEARALLAPLDLSAAEQQASALAARQLQLPTLIDLLIRESAG